ncbi:MAG: phosphoribosylformylglycinamidine synthase subunit PurL, partial [Mycobacteriales bacterium]
MTEAPRVTEAPPPDTVTVAIDDPDRPQPFAELGLAPGEFDRIRALLGRRPTECELAMYAVMWSEHCSYKSSKVHLRRFAELPAPARLLAGIGANAGVVDVGGGLAVTFKVESHNHPSYVEPYQGAATGVGGIVRDILAMGARPVAVMDSLRFGDAEAPDSQRLVPGVVAGVGGYGNCLGLPNIGGEVVFDPSYAGNPLVNALCVGVLPAERLQRAAATGAGNVVVLFGARTGRDGIGGVSVLASASFEADGPAKRPSVQVGDPFTEKVLIECTLELFDRGLVVGIQDLGGAGLTCALCETAAAAGTGMTVRLHDVPLREPSMLPWEVLTSESQERMLAIVAPDQLPDVLATCGHWGVTATPIGEVTDTGRLVVRWHDEIVADLPPGSLADDGPVYDRPQCRPAALAARQADRAEALPRPTTSEDLRATLLALAASPNLCDRRWVTEQYDRYVLGNTVFARPEDAGVIRLLENDASPALALSLDCNGRFAALDPYVGAQLALAEAARNVAATGAEPVAVTDCLNFGSPEDPEVMWAFAEAVRGLADGCRDWGLPVTGGNVSFYNQTAGAPVHPTPVVGVLGLLGDVRRRTPLAFTVGGDTVVLLGRTREELSGSEWAWVAHRHLGGRPPKVDLAAEQALVRVLVAGARSGLLRSAHDLSDGGLAQALVECCLSGGQGVRIELPIGLDPFVALFSESAARAVVALPPERAPELAGLCARHGVADTPIGTVGGTALEVAGLFGVDLAELAVAHRATLP